MKSKKAHKGETKTAVKVPAVVDQTLLTDIRDLLLPRLMNGEVTV
jgi:hypothetical protein